MISFHGLKLWIFAIILSVITFHFLRYLRKVYILFKIPGPAMTELTVYLSMNQSQLFFSLREFAKRFKGIYRISFFHIHVINIYNPDDVEQILSGYKHNEKSLTYTFLQNWLGTGLLTSKGAKWRERRKLLTPAFHFQILQEFLASFNSETKDFVEFIKDNMTEVEGDIKKHVLNFTLKNICETAMGIEKVEEKTFKRYRQNIEELGALLVSRLLCIWHRPALTYQFSKEFAREMEVVKELHDFSYTVIEDRIKSKETETIKRKKLAMLDILLKYRDNGLNLDYEGIREEVDTFMFEGHDTTGSAINSILLLFANHPDVQAKAREEVEDIFQGEDRDCTIDDLCRMEYLDCCIKEALRLYPSVPFISRICGETFKTTTGYTIPKGTVMHVHIFDLHRNPKVFPDPERFDPERFRRDASTNRPYYSYIPFSGGPRNCIGQKFAMWEIKTLLSGILRNFRLEPIDKVEDITYHVDFVLNTKQPIRVKFIKNKC